MACWYEGALDRLAGAFENPRADSGFLFSYHSQSKIWTYGAAGKTGRPSFVRAFVNDIGGNLGHKPGKKGD